MEMEESALRHIMDTQTQMLQNLTRLQEEQARNNLTQGLANVSESATPVSNDLAPIQAPNLEMKADGHIETTMTVPISSPSAPPVAGNGLPVAAPGTPVSNLAVSNPTQYGTVAALPYVGGRPPAAPALTPRGFITGTLAEIRDFDPMHHSREATSEFFSDQTRGIQEQAVSVIGGAAGGAAAAGSLFVPGILPSLLVGGGVAAGVGGVTGAITEGASAALDYEELLQQEDYKFINAFESSDEMGGIGLGLEDRQEMAGFLRDLAPENFLDDPELMRILEGSSQNGLLKSVSDVKSFKDKFSEIVGAVREIAVTMNSSLEEATAFMGEMERRGISTRDMSYVAAQTKVTASVTGQSAEQTLQTVLSTSDAITEGTALEADNIMESTNLSMMGAQMVQDQAKADDSPVYNYIKNMGGAAEAGPAFEQQARAFVETDAGRQNLLAFFGSAFEVDESGEFVINEETMTDLVAGEYTNDQLRSMSDAARQNLTTAQQAELLERAPSLFSNSAQAPELSAFLDRSRDIIQEATNNSLSPEQALVEAGIAQDFEQAEFFEAMISQNTDPEMQAMLQGRALKEEMDSNAIANNPGVFTRARFWWERNVTNPMGDAGQAVSDEVGSAMQDYQQFITGVDDRSMVGGEALAVFEADADEQLVQSIEDLNRYMGENTEYLESRRDDQRNSGDIFGAIDTGVAAMDVEQGSVDAERISDILTNDESGPEFSRGTMNRYLARVNEGEMSATEIASLHQRIERDTDPTDPITGVGWVDESLDVIENIGNPDNDMGVLDQARAELVVEKSTGQYEGVLGTAEYGLRRGALVVAETSQNVAEFIFPNLTRPFVAPWDTEGQQEQIEEMKGEAGFNIAGIDLSQRSLERQREELVEDRQALTEEVVNLFTGGDLGNLSESEMKELEGAIESGDAGAVESITGNTEAVELAQRYSELETADETYSNAMGIRRDIERNTKGIATAGTQLGDLLKASGVYEEAYIDDMLGDLMETGSDTAKRLKDGDMTVEEMAETINATQGQIDEVFENMPEADAQYFAEFLQQRNPQQFSQAGIVDESGEVNVEKLQEYVMTTFQAQHTTNPETKAEGEEGDSAAKAADAAKDHQQAMAEFLTAYQNESQMLRDATEGRPVSSPNITSNQNRGG